VGLLPLLFHLFVGSQVTLHGSDCRLTLDPSAYAGRCRVHCGARRTAATPASSRTARDRALGLVMFGVLQDRLDDKAVHWRILNSGPISPAARLALLPALWDTMSIERGVSPDPLPAPRFASACDRLHRVCTPRRHGRESASPYATYPSTPLLRRPQRETTQQVAVYSRQLARR
jgi:hypothetical protein